MDNQKIALEEPVESDADLSAPKPFKEPRKKERDAMIAEIKNLKALLDPFHEATTLHNGTTVLEEKFKEIFKKEKFASIPGAKDSDFKLIINEHAQNAQSLSHDLHSLWRLRIAQKVVEDLKAEKIFNVEDEKQLSFSEALAIYRTEGNLDIAITVTGKDYKALPDYPTGLKCWKVN